MKRWSTAVIRYGTNFINSTNATFSETGPTSNEKCPKSHTSNNTINYTNNAKITMNSAAESATLSFPCSDNSTASITTAVTYLLRLSLLLRMK